MGVQQVMAEWQKATSRRRRRVPRSVPVRRVGCPEDALGFSGVQVPAHVLCRFYGSSFIRPPFGVASALPAGEVRAIRRGCGRTSPWFCAGAQFGRASEGALGGRVGYLEVHG